MQVKNKEALLKCGFEWDDSNSKYITKNIEVDINGKIYFNYDETFLIKNDNDPFNIKDLTTFTTKQNRNNIIEIFEKTIEMTKAGCFDEKPKTLEYYNYILIENNNTNYIFGSENFPHKIHIDIFYESYKVNSYVEISEDLHRAIMLKIEELKNE